MWRLGYYAEPLIASLEYQGKGRFDDPQRERTVLYGADAVSTCIYEIALPWKPHKDADYAHRTEAPESDVDHDLQQAELEQAERERTIAMRPFRMPATLYDYSKTLIGFGETLVVCDLDNITVRTGLSRIDPLSELMSELGVPHLDRSVLTGQGPFLKITQALSGYLMRNGFLGYEFPGLRALGRHAGYCFILFQDRYAMSPPLVPPIRLTPEDPEVIEAAANLHLIP